MINFLCIWPWATSIWKLCLIPFLLTLSFAFYFWKTGPKEFISLFYGLQSWRVGWRLIIILANILIWCNLFKLNICWIFFRVFLRGLIQTEVEKLIPMSCEKHFWVWALQSHQWSWTCWCLSLTKVVGKARPLNTIILSSTFVFFTLDLWCYSFYNERFWVML